MVAHLLRLCETLLAYFGRVPVGTFEGLEPYEVKVSRTVLGGLGRATAPGYPVLLLDLCRIIRPCNL